MPNLDSIVVAGDMNPKIHHPQWYYAHELLTEPERDAALAADLVCVPQFTQFRAPEFRILCQQQRWEIQTTIAESVGRMRDVTVNTFRILAETPVTAFGFNVHIHEDTELESVARRIAQRVAQLELGIDQDADAEPSAQVTYKTARAGRRRTVTISPSPRRPRAVLVVTNIHYDIHALGLGDRFDLGNLILEHHEVDREWAIDCARRVTAALSIGGQ